MREQIVRDDGSVVRTREYELTQDEVIDTLRGDIEELQDGTTTSDISTDEPVAPEAQTAQSPKIKKTNREAAGERETKPRSLTCKACGEPGHMAKTCPKNAPAFVPKDRAVLNRLDYRRVKDLMGTPGYDGGGIALELKLPVVEVRAALRATDYDDYVNNQ